MSKPVQPRDEPESIAPASTDIDVPDTFDNASRVSPTPVSCAAIVLAAGASTRLGQPKQLVLFQGESLLRHAVKLALAVNASPVLVVLGAHLEKCRAVLVDLPITILENADHATGMGSGLQLGIAALTTFKPGPERVLLLACDQPLLQPSHLQQLLRAPTASGIAAAGYNGRTGVPAVFSQEHFPALASVTGDQGARTLLRTLSVTQVSMPEAAIDIDIPQDLQALATSSK